MCRFKKRNSWSKRNRLVRVDEKRLIRSGKVGGGAAALMRTDSNRMDKMGDSDSIIFFLTFSYLQHLIVLLLSSSTWAWCVYASISMKPVPLWALVG